MEELAARLVDTLIGVRAEEVTLGLQQIGRQALGTVAVIECQSCREGRRGNPISDAVNDGAAPGALILVQDAFEEIIKQKVGEVRILLVSHFDFAEKAAALADLRNGRFHLIGHLQSNKAQLASRLFQVIQTVDSEKLLNRLDRTAQEQGRSIEVLFEIKLSSEASKTGAAPEDIPALLRAADQCPALKITGLMSMPPWSEDAEQSRPFFRRLAQLAHQNGLPKLSMGMSGDFEVAIEEGSTLIRVGTALFGARPKPANALS